jgi:hypothetical protein
VNPYNLPTVDISQLKSDAAAFAALINRPWHSMDEDRRKEMQQTFTRLVEGFGGPEVFVEKVKFNLFDASHMGQEREVRLRIVKGCIDLDNNDPHFSYFFFATPKITEAIEALP